MALYALVVVKNICLRDKSRNYCPRKLPGACHGDDFGLVEKWKSLFWAVQTVIVLLLSRSKDTRV